MAAPEYVPTAPATKVRAYASPPLRPGGWEASRPGDIDTVQPEGKQLGTQGPDQGYALKLANDHIAGELKLQSGEHAKDALAGIVAVGLKRASVFGRAPILADLRIAATIYGFLDTTPDAELVAMRRKLFEEVGHFHHYLELRAIVDIVPAESLRATPADVEARHAADWRSLLSL